MSNAGSITVDLLAQTGSFDDGIATSRRSLQTFGTESAQVSAAAAGSFNEAGRSVTATYEQINKTIQGNSSRVAASVKQTFADATAGAKEQLGTFLSDTAQNVESVAKGIAISVAIGAVSAAAAAAYTAYKIASATAGFINGLFTGESYKSSDIDALIKVNDQVKELQRNLSLSAQDARALLDATGRLGVKKEDVVTVSDSTQKSVRTNTEELDRLGIVYKDQNGKILEQEQLLKNAKKALDEYTVGYNRNAAAAAVGFGSYEQINAALKVNQEELKKSRDRINDFNLGIGPESQAAIAAYQQALRDFNSEAEKSSQAVSRAYADALLPALTDLAVFFKDGFPAVGNSVRAVLGGITESFYVFKTIVFGVSESVLAALESMFMGISALQRAALKLAQGDVKEAINSFAIAFEAGKDRFALARDNFLAQAASNQKAVRLALGLDDRAATGDKPTGNKDFTPAPPKPSAAMFDPDALTRKLLQGQIKTITDFAAQQKQAYDFVNKSVQLSYDEGNSALQQFFDEQKAVRAAGLQSETEALDKQVAVLREFRERFVKPENRADVDNRIAEALDKRTKAVQAAGFATALIDREDALRKRALLDQYNDLVASVRELSGDSLGAAALRQLRQSREAVDLVTAQGGDPQVALELSRQGAARNALNFLNEQAALITQEQATAEGMLEVARQTGATNELQSLRLVGEERRRSLEALRPLVEEYERLARLSGDPRLVASANALRLGLEQLNATVDPLQQKFRDLFETSFTGPLVDFVTRTKTAGQAFKDFTRIVATELTKLQAQNFARAISGSDAGKGATGFLSSLFGRGSSSGGSGGGLLDGIGDVFLKIFGYADGGQPPVGKVSLVGERGPELFVPNTAGTVIPNHALGGVAFAPVYNIDARGADAGVEARIRQGMAQATRDAVAQVQYLANRGGSFSRAVGR